MYVVGLDINFALYFVALVSVGWQILLAFEQLQASFFAEVSPRKGQENNQKKPSNQSNRLSASLVANSHVAQLERNLMCLGLATSWELWSLKLCVLIDFGILSVFLPFLTYIWRNHYNIYHYMLKRSSKFLMFSTCQKIQSRKPSEDNGRCWNETKACRRHVLNQLHQTFMVITMKLQVLKAENWVILTEKNSLGQLWARTCSIHFARRSRCLHQGPVSFWKIDWSWLQNSESAYILNMVCPLSLATSGQICFGE